MTMDPPLTAQPSARADGDVTPPVVSAGESPVRFRLYLSLPTPTSVRGKANLDAILAGLGSVGRNIVMETVDVAASPLKALGDRIIVTPTLMFCSDAHMPPTIVGDFSDAGAVRAFIEAALRTAAANGKP
jgi:hypothetical protein